ncbi:MAG: ABC transporter permease subunit [Streptosporangiales bacterium]|nr:ABC transporter permease subunit [Streptosporangiales bacterium]
MGVDLRPTRQRPRPAATTRPAGATERARWRSRIDRLDVKASPYLYIAPFYLVFAVFGLFPLGYTLWVSLHDWELIGKGPFIGLANYAQLLGDPYFWNSILNTIGIFVVATVPQLVLALMLANALNRWLRLPTFFRMGVLLPMVTSVAAVAIVFGQLYARDFGMINWLLGLVGAENVDWRGSKWASWIAISTMVDWRWTGYNTLIYLAAMQAIPRDLYEAAAIDGASRRRQLWQITVPMIRPTIIFTVIISTIGGLQLFTEPVLFERSGHMAGGTLRQFQTVTMFMFENAFRDHDYGYGAAIAWMIFCLILIASLVNFLIIRRLGGTK